MQYSQEHLKTMVYAEFGGQTECIMGNWKIENTWNTWQQKKKKKKKRKILKHVMNCRKKFSNLSFPLMML